MMGLKQRWDDIENPYLKYGIPTAGTLALGGTAMALMGGSGNPQQPAIQATQATGQPNANEMAMVGDNTQLALNRRVYGDPLNDMEALQQAAKMSKDLYKFPEKKEKAIRDAEIEGQLQALTAAALQQQYLN